MLQLIVHLLVRLVCMSMRMCDCQQWLHSRLDKQ